MHSVPTTRPHVRVWAGIAVLVVLAAWLVPNPLPWRSPLQGGDPAPTGSGATGIGPGAEGAGRTATGSSPAPPPASRTSRPSATEAAGAVPVGFRGTWRGNGVNLLFGQPFAVVVTFPATPAGAVVATADYPALGCQEAWQLVQRTPTLLRLRATLARGQGLCIDRPLRVQVRLLDVNHLLVRWHLLDARGTAESEATVIRGR